LRAARLPPSLEATSPPLPRHRQARSRHISTAKIVEKTRRNGDIRDERKVVRASIRPTAPVLSSVGSAARPTTSTPPFVRLATKAIAAAIATPMLNCLMTGHSPRRCADDVGLDAALERSSIERSARCFQIFPVIIETIKSLLLRRLIRIGRGIQKTLLAPSRSIDKTAERRWRVGAGNLDTSRAPSRSKIGAPGRTGPLARS
jgi:hypothetical protein